MRRLLLLLLLALVAACGPRVEEGPAPTPQEEPPQPQPPRVPVGLKREWNEIRTGGDTVCARGTPYSFFVHPGTTNKVVIDFMGGGACWTQDSCGFAGALFDDSVDTLRDRVKDGFPGVYDRSKPQNPFKDWFHVVIPYCTGDIHWGDSVQTYGEGEAAITIRHKGAVNARAVLDWVYAQFDAPERILVTGCSAGSYGSIMWAPHIKRHYPKAVVRQFGDSGAGVVTSDFFRDSFPRWDATRAAPAFIPTLDPATTDWQSLALPDLYARIGAFYPELRLSQFNTAYDETQVFFYKAMGGGTAQEWSKAMLASIDRIHETTPSFRSYIGPGKQHCVLPDDNYATFESNGVKFLDWLERLLNEDEHADVRCVDCGQP
ncbi:MAG: pectin acetylesterase-family hydrolase [Myxococcales bacterium]